MIITVFYNWEKTVFLHPYLKKVRRKSTNRYMSEIKVFLIPIENKINSEC